jgi:Secretion system C-terminal sorting domain
MKKALLFFLMLLSFPVVAQFNYQRAWSTYYFGAISSAAKTIIDNEGNIIVVGGVNPNTGQTLTQPLAYYDQWSTPGVYQTNISSYNSAGFITKFSPDGGVLWSSYFTTSSSASFREVEVDSNNNIYITGITNSVSGIATPGAFITDIFSIAPYSATTNPLSVNFLTKFSSSGTREWGTYLPRSIVNVDDRALHVDSSNNIYFGGNTVIENTNIATTGSFKENFVSYPPLTLTTANKNGYILKFDAQGNRVAGTYCGANVDIGDITSDSEGNIIIVGYQDKGTNDVLSSPSSYQPERSSNTGSQGFISKFSPDLSSRIWSTYYADAGGNTLLKVATLGTDIYCYGEDILELGFFATPGSFSEIPALTYLARFTNMGYRVWGTYLPFFDFNGYSNLTNIEAKNDKIYVFGRTNFTSGIGTAGAFQENKNMESGSINDGYFMQFSTDGERNWGSYYGGEKNDGINSIAIQDNNTFYFCGNTNSTTGIASPESLQPELNSGVFPAYSASNMFLAKFTPVLSTASFAKSNFQIAPNPSNGKFMLTGSINATQDDLSLVIYDNLGRIIASQNVVNSSAVFQQDFDFSGVLSKGIYFAKLLSGKESMQTFKILVK